MKVACDAPLIGPAADSSCVFCCAPLQHEHTTHTQKQAPATHLSKFTVRDPLSHHHNRMCCCCRCRPPNRKQTAQFTRDPYTLLTQRYTLLQPLSEADERSLPHARTRVHAKLLAPSRSRRCQETGWEGWGSGFHCSRNHPSRRSPPATPHNNTTHAEVWDQKRTASHCKHTHTCTHVTYTCTLPYSCLAVASAASTPACCNEIQETAPPMPTIVKIPQVAAKQALMHKAG